MELRIENAPDAVRIRRLRTLADWLEGLELQPGQFDLGAWHRTNDCGTAACAVGWGMLCPALQEEGLGFVRDHDGDLMPYYSDGKDLVLWHWDAVEHFFCNPASELREYSGTCMVLVDCNGQYETWQELYAYLFCKTSYAIPLRKAVVLRLREVADRAEQLNG